VHPRRGAWRLLPKRAREKEGESEALSRVDQIKPRDMSYISRYELYDAICIPQREVKRAARLTVELASRGSVKAVLRLY
jgi:hypothetical protein